MKDSAPTAAAVIVALTISWTGATSAAPPRLHEAVHPVAPGLLAVVLDDQTTPPSSAAEWTLASSDDPNYQGGRSPVTMARRTRAAELIPQGWPYPALVEHEILLQFDEPLSAGATYELSSATGLQWTVPFDPTQDWCPALKVNQVGYLPEAAGRYAYVSYWLSTLAPLQLDEGERSFQILDDTTGEMVLAGEARLWMAHDQATDDAYDASYGLANVYELDLGGLTAPGRYFVVWQGVGRSFTFALDSAVYDTPFTTTFRALFHQRCGTALAPSLTSWSHAECHAAPVHLTSADYHVVGADAFEALPAADIGTTVDAKGGHHDAGDYDRRIEHLAIVDALVDLFEIDAQRFASDTLDIPESGNAIPDVLDESLWAIELYVQLQDVDGGVRAGIETTGYPDWAVMPEDDVGWTWYAYAKDPRSSYRFAGAAAKLSRALSSFDDERAQDLLQRAERAWTWAEANPAGYDSNVLASYAAAELLRSTGNVDYDLAFQQRGPFAGGNLTFSLQDWDSNDWIPALYAYASCSTATADYRDAARRVLQERAESWVQWGQLNSYRLVKSPYAPAGYGSLTTPHGANLLARVHHLTGDPQLLEWTVYNGDVVLGANWSGWSWVTGLGPKSVRRPLHNPSLGDGIDEPVPGITVYGPSRQEQSGGILGSVLDVYQPPVDAWPLAERFADVSYVPVLNEFTVQESIATTAFAFGYLATMTSHDGPGGGGGSGGSGSAGTGGAPGGAGTEPASDGDGDCDCRAGRAGRMPPWLLSLGLLLGLRRRRT